MPSFIGKDSVIEYLREKAKKEPQIKRLVLFGSRSKNSEQARSDYDVAVFTLGDIRPTKWILETHENVPTLCGLDLVWVSKDISRSLLDAIQNEGKLIYEK